MGSWHMKLQLLAAFLDARQESLQHFPVANLRGEPLDDCLPYSIINPAGNAPVDEDFHIAFGLGYEDQHARIGIRMVQIQLDKLPAREITGTPVAHGRRNQTGQYARQPENQRQDDKHHPLHQQ